MIASLAHADRLTRHYQDQMGAREVVNGAPVAWPPSDDPREIVRRVRYLEKLGSTAFEPPGNVLADALRAYANALDAELKASEPEAVNGHVH